ncbi:hypothetical protein [Roseimicrobium sp. ORNL1]|uniref:hypothetical protein n=1 Tax=Roseimicrobium sp. ORNL1 TaxID=2711231 RepID=UPI0013E1B78E|nr:hypothetical protein [Roseimicrobium sp. ORNL1]QIF01194.1 hypothetical protein G5S37_06560 [Roseimicrobium sp. ORNL1]
MLQFIAQHVDALITILGGIFACFVAIRRTPARTEAQKRSLTILKVCGPLMILYGTFRLTEQPPPPSWQRLMTLDRAASVEFPGETKTQEQTDTLDGVSVLRTSLVHGVPFKEISIFLSFSKLPPGQENIPDAEKITALKMYFTQQGFTVIHEEPMQLGSTAGFALALERDAGKIRFWTRVAYANGNVYWVLVISAGSHHDDPIISRCLSSFQMEAPST